MTTESKSPTLNSQGIGSAGNARRDSWFVRFRVSKRDSAYVYAILEANEGIATYSTLDHRPGDHYRDLFLSIPIGFRGEVEELLEVLRQELKGELYVLHSDSRP